jgi:hypothetical protein
MGKITFGGVKKELGTRLKLDTAFDSLFNSIKLDNMNLVKQNKVKSISPELLIQQKLLEKIYELVETNITTLSSCLNYSKDMCHEFCKRLHRDEYISFIDSSTLDGKDAIIQITESGKLFILGGGYIQLEQDKQKETEIEKEIQRLTIKNLKLNIFQLKYWWLFLIITALISYLVKFIPIK